MTKIQNPEVLVLLHVIRHASVFYRPFVDSCHPIADSLLSSFALSSCPVLRRQQLPFPSDTDTYLCRFKDTFLLTRI